MSDSHLNFTVRGAESEDDVRTITDELQKHQGVQMVDIDAESGRAEIRYGEELLSAEEIKSTVRDAGYEVE